MRHCTLPLVVACATASCALTGAPNDPIQAPIAVGEVDAVLGTGAETTRRVPATDGQGVTSGYDDGFYLRSGDGRNQLKIGGLFQVTGGYFGTDRDPGADVALRRMRPEITGRFLDSLRFALEPKFDEHGVELEEAWVGVEFGGGDSLLMLGRMKVPFGLEEVRSRRHIDFTHFSILNQFSPAEDHGVFWNGRSESGRWEYNFAAYNGTGTSDTTSSKDVAARLMVHPHAGEEGSALRNLQVGLAATVGSQDEDVGGDAIENALGLPVIRFDPDVRLNGTRSRAGFEMAWFDGPSFVQGELFWQNQEMEDAATDGRVSFQGAYLTLARVLTGEEKTFGGVSPANPYSFGGGGGSGAWVLAARFSELQLGDDLDGFGFAEAGTFTEGIRTVSLGLNWIPNDHVILRNAFVYSMYDDSVSLDSGTDDRELGFLMEAQLHF